MKFGSSKLFFLFFIISKKRDQNTKELRFNLFESLSHWKWAGTIESSGLKDIKHEIKKIRDFNHKSCRNPHELFLSPLLSSKDIFGYTFQHREMLNQRWMKHFFGRLIFNVIKSIDKFHKMERENTLKSFQLSRWKFVN